MRVMVMVARDRRSEIDEYIETMIDNADQIVWGGAEILLDEFWSAMDEDRDTMMITRTIQPIGIARDNGRRENGPVENTQ